jgi:ABC-type hemin transport system substrate-binding protein
MSSQGCSRGAGLRGERLRVLQSTGSTDRRGSRESGRDHPTRSLSAGEPARSLAAPRLASHASRFTVDDLARPLLLGARVQRIVSLAPSCTECLLAVGAGERLVGIDNHSDFPEPLTAVVRVGGFKHLDLARVTGLAPGLVVAASLHAVSFLPRLETQRTRVFVLMPRTVDGIVDGMARLASVLGLAAEAAPYLASCRTRIATSSTEHYAGVAGRSPMSSIRRKDTQVDHRAFSTTWS